MTAEGGARPRLHPQGPQVGGGQVDGVLPYRRQAATSGQYPGHGHPPSPTNIAPLTRGRVPYEVLVEVENPAR